MRSALATVTALCLGLLACGRDGTVSPRAPSISERLQGQWKSQGDAREGEYKRVAFATVEVQPASFKYSYYFTYVCDTFATDTVNAVTTPACDAEQPHDHGGYFEGLYRIVDDSLELQDATEAASYRNLKDSSFDFVVNGTVFPMTRD